MDAIKHSLITQYKRILSLFKYIGGINALIFYSMQESLFSRKGRKLIRSIMVNQIYFTGNMAHWTIVVVAFTLGAITVIQLFTQLSKVGALNMIGTILNVVIVRELGPLITAFIVIARSGSAIAAEIGTMMVNNEVNAIEMQGISTLKLVVYPRIMGVTIAMFVLTIYFVAVGLLGGFTIGNLYAGITFDTFQRYIINSIGVADILIMMFKSIAFGLFISSISIYFGFQAFTTTQIPQMTTKAVVRSIFALFFMDVIITLGFSL